MKNLITLISIIYFALSPNVPSSAPISPAFNVESQITNPVVPTITPIVISEQLPSVSPTITPTIAPTVQPTTTPSPSLTLSPTRKPTSIPTKKPTVKPTSRPNIIATPIPATNGFTCDCSKTCPNMGCAEAQFQLNSCGCSRRDADHDGVACDANCQ